ncbi:glycoside hydrolase family 78 protein [Pseudopedobacter beijingensis]|uniref:alpha-L-rhamnosidase n=1 Tax=Pseudopedobacter beijingensis TaxID=1207056 RepID=A0ABW4IBM6_9SPHI
MKKALFLLISLFCAGNVFSQTIITNLLTENLKEPMGLGVTHPRFTWQLHNNKRGVVQTAYEINVRQDNTEIWNSGKIISDSSVMLVYKGPVLKSNTKYSWDVKVWDNIQKDPVQSETATFHTGFFITTDWKAKWIAPGFAEDTINRPSPYFRKEFNTEKSIKSANLFVTSHGMYEAYINGKRVGDAYFTPGWTSYHKRLQYQVYNVTNLLAKNNTIGVMLASGWYRGVLGFANKKDFYGKSLALLLQLEIKYSDGSKETIITDESWKSSTGKITYSEIYNGEKTDLRLEKEGWTASGYNDSVWDKVMVNDFSKDNLIGTYNEAVKEHEIFKPLKIFTTPKGEKVIDFGQNLVGWVKMKVKGRAGQIIKLSHAEVLDHQGNFYTANLRSAKAQDFYTLKNDKETILKPHFTWHGFRYVKIDGYPGELKPEHIEAVALYSAMDQTGSFSSSHTLVNQLQSNIEWGQKGNFLEIPTDCNQRNERLGWTGDIQVFAHTGTFNMRIHNFLVKWLADVKAEQLPDGQIPSFVPSLNANLNRAGWADAITIVPWTLYLTYGDKRILSEQYGAMKAYVESVRKVTNNDLWDTGLTFGDWLGFKAEEGQKNPKVTHKNIITQAYYANSIEILANTAMVLGYQKDAEEYKELLKRARQAFHKAFINEKGDLISQSQTAYSLALNFKMIPDSLEQRAAERLVKLINEFGHFTTGFLATAPLCHVLTRYGYTDVAYKLLERQEYPSWLYPVTKGATTFWERWNGIQPDGTFPNRKPFPAMNSFNHYAHGAIGDWMYRKMVGIDTDESEAGVGYKHITIKPHPGGSFTHAQASLKTYYGRVSSSWNIDGNKLIVNVEIPVNTTATIYLPTEDAQKITESNEPIKSIKEISIQSTTEDKKIPLKVGSGIYQFVVNGYVK